MALQPAAGARDLNPREVEGNRRIREQLAAVYRLWGYREVDPPSVETLSTLEAGGGIAAQELVRLASDDPLGLRPELTASIARAACTRMTDHPVPLRLWADGNIYRCCLGASGGQRIIQTIHSGVELLGEASGAAEAELTRLLLAAASAVGLVGSHPLTLLIGHHGLLQLLLEALPVQRREQVRVALTSYDPLSLQNLDLEPQQRQRLLEILQLRGEPDEVLRALRRQLGELALLDSLSELLALVAPAAARFGVRLQFDPSFQPHFNLYDGLVLKLVCQGPGGPVAVASGGRYDALVGRFSSAASLSRRAAAGAGFGFDVEAVRELVLPPDTSTGPLLVAYSSTVQLATAIERLEQLHAQGQAAELHPVAIPERQRAEQLATERGCSGLQWLDAYDQVVC